MFLILQKNNICLDKAFIKLKTWLILLILKYLQIIQAFEKKSSL